MAGLLLVIGAAGCVQTPPALQDTAGLDDFYGITLGAGLLIGNRVNLDIAYQYRWGRDVRKDTFSVWDIDADVDRHDLYLSTVINS